MNRSIYRLSNWSIYLLECCDESIYCGITTDVSRRVKEHNESDKAAKYTKSRRPVILLISFEVPTKNLALKLEYKIKQLSRKEKLELIKNNSLFDIMKEEQITKDSK